MMRAKSVFTALALATTGLTAAGCASTGESAPGGQINAISTRNGVTTIPVRLEAGDEYLLSGRLTSTSKVPGSEADLTYTASYTMALEVEEMGREGGVWRWSIENVAIESMQMPDVPQIPLGQGFNDAMSAGARLLTDIDFVCRVDATGACVELLNWPDWRERVENLAIITAGTLQFVAAVQGGETPGDAAAAQPNYEAIAKAVQDVTAVLMNGIDNRTAAGLMAMPMVTGLQGQSLRAGVQTPVETLVPLPYGADPIRLTGSVTLESVDRSAGVATFTRASTLDQVALKASINAMIADLTPQIMAAVQPVIPASADGSDPAAAAQFMVGMAAAALSAFDIQYVENTRGTVDLATGLVRNAETTFTMTMKGPGGESYGEAVTQATFSFAPGAPPRPRLGGPASAQ